MYGRSGKFGFVKTMFSYLGKMQQNPFRAPIKGHTAGWTHRSVREMDKRTVGTKENPVSARKGSTEGISRGWVDVQTLV